jgi:hypothetical protein
VFLAIFVLNFEGVMEKVVIKKLMKGSSALKSKWQTIIRKITFIFFAAKFFGLNIGNSFIYCNHVIQNFFQCARVNFRTTKYPQNCVVSQEYHIPVKKSNCSSTKSENFIFFLISSYHFISLRQNVIEYLFLMPF